MRNACDRLGVDVCGDVVGDRVRSGAWRRCVLWCIGAVLCAGLMGCEVDRTNTAATGQGDEVWAAARSAEAESAELARLRSVVEAGGGDVGRGRGLFAGMCGRCHRLHGSGGDVGPDLTNYDRSAESLDFLLKVIADPGREALLDENHQLYEVTTTDGRVLHGAVVEAGAGYIVLAEVTGVRTVIPDQNVVGSRRVVGTLMEQGLLGGLGDRELRDLFAFLTSDGL